MAGLLGLACCELVFILNIFTSNKPKKAYVYVFNLTPPQFKILNPPLKELDPNSPYPLLVYTIQYSLSWGRGY